MIKERKNLEVKNEDVVNKIDDGYYIHLSIELRT
jgi:hypothetical protein